jgi:hypothetical protein
MCAMRLEANERWTGARLAALAAALHLPCPARESFLFDADHAFRTSCTESDITLQRAIKRVFQHAGVRCDAVVVLWKTGIRSTRVERDGDSWFFEIDASWRTNAIGLGVIAAREAGRALLASRSVQRMPGTVGDVDEELAVVLAGLGSLLAATDSQADEGARAAGATLVVLPPRLVRYAIVRVTKSLGLGLRRTLDVVPLKIHITLLWPRVSARALPFAALPSHVIIRCFCAKRLRVPTGAVGETKCPACSRKRPFDGRACRTEIQTRVPLLPNVPLPVATPLQRLGIAFLDIPLVYRAFGIVIVALIAMIVVLRR